jgi:hypothetical protein
MALKNMTFTKRKYKEKKRKWLEQRKTKDLAQSRFC